MKQFIVRRGVFLKTNNDIERITKKLSITLLGYALIKLLTNSLMSILGLLYCILCAFIVEYIELLLKNKKSIKKLPVYDTLTVSLVVYLFINGNNYLFMTLTIILISILKRLLYNNKKVLLNPYLIGLLLPALFNHIGVLNNAYIIIYSFSVLVYLLIKRYVKSYIVITLIIGLLLSGIFYNNILLSLLDNNILPVVLYIIPYSKSTPLTHSGQVLYSLILCILIIMMHNINNYVIISSIIVEIIYISIYYIEGRKLR